MEKRFWMIFIVIILAIIGYYFMFFVGSPLFGPFTEPFEGEAPSNPVDIINLRNLKVKSNTWLVEGRLFCVDCYNQALTEMDTCLEGYNNCLYSCDPQLRGEQCLFDCDETFRACDKNVKSFEDYCSYYCSWLS